MGKWSDNPLAWCLIPFGVSASLVGTVIYKNAMKQQQENNDQMRQFQANPQSNRQPFNPS